MNRDSSSRVLRANHHSLNQKNSPISIHNSKADSTSKRKMSTASMKENMPDIDKLINDIKIVPNNNYTQSIKKIMNSLKDLQKFEIVADEVKAVSMLVQSIEKKITSYGLAVSRGSKNSLKSSGVNQKKNQIDFKLYSELTPKSEIHQPYSQQKLCINQSSHKNQTILKLCNMNSQSINNSLNQVSPIKQMAQNSSRIIYSNLSLKQLQKNIQNSSIKKDEKIESGIKIAISQFDENQSGGQEINKLNEQIKYLQELLARKTMSQAPTTMTNKPINTTQLFRKKSNKF